MIHVQKRYLVLLLIVFLLNSFTFTLQRKLQKSLRNQYINNDIELKSSFFSDIIRAFVYVFDVCELLSCTGSWWCADFHHHVPLVLRCVESHMLRACLHGALQGNGWKRVRARAEVCLFVRSRSVRCMGEQTGLCCVVKGVALFLRAHCYHLYTEG